MTTEQRYVWWFQGNGDFSDSWGEQEHKELVRDMNKNPERYQATIEDLGAKLIKYTCVNDKDFEFSHQMKIVTNVKEKR